ncbi:MAG: DegV family protein [Ruminococcus sp.]|nr:DegV family protein [Ruminococcus sp.]
MRKIKIISDSCSDLTAELMEKYDLDYATMYFVRDGKENKASLTWEQYSPAEYFGMMREGEKLSTTQVPAGEFDRIFRQYLSEGYDVIYIGISNRQSGSVNTGTVVAKEVLKDFPDAKISCINSLNGSIGIGMLAIYASKLVKAGKSFDEIVDEVTAQRKKVNQFMTVYSLESFRRTGRVENDEAYQANLMAVKPIMIADANGAQVPVKKVRGRAASLAEIVDMAAAAGANDAVQDDCVYVSQADITEEELEDIKKLVAEKLPNKKLVIVPFGPIIGVSVGADAVGLWAFGNEVTYKAGEAAK